MTDITWTNTTVKLGDLKPWADNPRTSTKAQAKRILKSIDQFGQVAPVVVGPDLSVYDGHQRLSALLTIHGKDYAIEARQSSRPLSDDERRALVLALANATGSWNWDLLSGWQTETLTDWGFDKDTLKGWKSDVTALGEFLKSEQPAKDAEPEVDRAAELLEKWGVKPGDLWQIGEHRLICGDCTDAATVARVMNGERADCVLIDPPYSSGGFQEAGKKSGSIGTRSTETIANDNLSTRGYRLLLLDALANFKNADSLYIFTDWRMWIECFDISERAGWKVRSMIVWDKEQMGMGFPWRSQHELVLFGKQTAAQMMDGKCGNVLKAQRTGNDNHPTEKPAELIEQLISNTVGEIFVDFFSGSGTTLVACENLRRKCRAIELSPAYVAVALERMSQAFPHLDIRRVE